jgi:dipeptidyl-peptidase-4
MKKHFFILILLVVTIIPGYAQNKLLTVEDAVLRQRNTLAPQSLKQLAWINGTTNFSYIDNDNLIIGNAKDQSKITVERKDVNAALKKANTDTLADLSVISWINANSFTVKTALQQFDYDISTKKIVTQRSTTWPENTDNTDEEASTHYRAYTVKNNLFVRFKNKVQQVTNDENENIVNGKSVHREEFGIYKGTFWSPKANYLAFYRMDQSMVNDYPIVDYGASPAKNNNIKYPMAGGTSHEVTVGVYDLARERTVFLKSGGEKDHYLTNIAWSPDESKVYIAELNRDQNHLQLNSYNALTGELIQTLFEEKNEKYVQPLHPLEFIDKSHFIWQSKRDGHNHLYLYDINGKLQGQLTKGNWEVLEVKGFTSGGDTLFITTSAESPINKDLYSLVVKTGKLQRLTSGSGTHTITISDNRQYAIDNYTSTIVPRQISLIRTSDGNKQVLLTAENPLKDYKMGTLNIFTIKTENNIDLYCRMLKPVGFDSTKKYPVIVYVYGGPNVQLITNSWMGGADLWFQYMAEKGFLLFTVDSRGSEGRGMAFEQATFRQLGTVEMYDQLKGVDYLKTLPYVDQNRMGVYGWSFGGFMTTSLMTRHPGVFKTAVAGGPVIDWSYYEVMYTERYMDTPEKNKKGYDESNLLNYAQNLKGKLLMIHGGIDDVVVWQHSLMFVKKCVDTGVQLDYFVYPGHLHNVIGKDRVHLLTKISDYFIVNL